MASFQEQRPPVQLASNNPFRRAASPSSAASPTSPTAAFPQLSPPMSGQARTNRVSTNPFLDSYRSDMPTMPQRKPSPPRPGTSGGGNHVVHPPAYSREDPVRMMNGLSINDENVALPRSGPRTGSMPMSGHRPTHSQEEALQRSRRERRDRREGANGPEMNVFEDPPVRSHRPRRNSETSMLDVRDEERRQKERERRHRERGEKSSRRGPDGHRRRPNKQVDTIDKLDVSGIYGPNLFHHDGPFDACNPQRNRRGRKAPMEAFPQGSANNVLGGSGPINKTINYDTFHGRGAEAYSDYVAGQQPGNRPMSPQKPNQPRHKASAGDFNSKDKVEYIHGDESAGLGSSTFLDGAPASKAAMRRESEGENAPTTGGPGLSRKRSLAMRIRGIQQRGPRMRDGAAVSSPEERYNDGGRMSPYSPQSAGGRSRTQEKNPFFTNAASVASTQEVNKEPHVQATAVASNGSSGSSRVRQESPPSRATRPARNGNTDSNGVSYNRTNDWGEPILEEPQGRPVGNGNLNASSGFLGRVKSLRGKKTRPQRSGSGGNA